MRDKIISAIDRCFYRLCTTNDLFEYYEGKLTGILYVSVMCEIITHEESMCIQDAMFSVLKGLKACK